MEGVQGISPLGFLWHPWLIPSLMGGEPLAGPKYWAVSPFPPIVPPDTGVTVASCCCFISRSLQCTLVGFSAFPMPVSQLSPTELLASFFLTGIETSSATSELHPLPNIPTMNKNHYCKEKILPVIPVLQRSSH